MVQYHALGLLYHIRRADKLAVAKLLVTLTRGGLRSPHAYCFLIRMAFKQIEDDQDDNGTCFDFIESCLRCELNFGCCFSTRGGPYNSAVFWVKVI